MYEKGHDGGQTSKPIPLTPVIGELITAGMLFDAYLHEARTPLTSIEAYLMLLSRRIEMLDIDQQDQREMLEWVGRASDGVRRAQKLTNDVRQSTRFRVEAASTSEFLRSIARSVGSLAILDRPEGCHIDFDDINDRDLPRMEQKGLGPILRNVLLFTVFSARSIGEITLSVPNASTILVSCDDPAFQEIAASVADFDPVKSTDPWPAMFFYLAQNLAQALKGTVRIEKQALATTIAIHVPVDRG